MELNSILYYRVFRDGPNGHMELLNLDIFQKVDISFCRIIIYGIIYVSCL